MLELGLARISQLIRHTPLRWQAVHIAGTNGKGSVAAYISALLHGAGVVTGRFTSPHLIDRWDCITVNEATVQGSFFKNVEKEVKDRDQSFNVGASEFELLTATAFEIFNRTNVEVGVVEVGLGGRLDATNALNASDVMLSVVTKIGFDHQNLLGHTIEAIAVEKGGIMKQNVPCLVDGTNAQEALNTLKRCSVRSRSPLTIVTTNTLKDISHLSKTFFQNMDLEAHQEANLALALTAYSTIQTTMHLARPVDELLHIIPKVKWPGRLQNINIKSLTGRERDVLLDGAHNVESAKALSSHINRKLRQPKRPLTWVLAMSKGKDVRGLIECLVNPGDNVVATEFGPVDGMPWVRCTDPQDIEMAAEGAVESGSRVRKASSVQSALQMATDSAADGPLVVAGSLYLASDVLRLLRDTNAGYDRVVGRCANSRLYS